jgi:hypothetical protein
MTKNPILLNRMMEDLTQALAPEKVQAIHDKLDRIIALLTPAEAAPAPAEAVAPPDEADPPKVSKKKS